MLRSRNSQLVLSVFKREMTAFFQLKSLWIVFFVQPFLFTALSSFVHRTLIPLYRVRPDLLELMVSRQVSVLLIAFSFMSTLHIVQKSIIAEKANGLLDTLLSTPLSVAQLVWGNALFLGTLGYTMGLILAILNITVVSLMLGTWSLIAMVPGYYWLFAFLVAPLITVGVQLVVVAASLTARDPRPVIMAFMLLVIVLIGGGSIYQTAVIEYVTIAALSTLGIACHAWWRIVGGAIARERVLAR